MTGPTLEFVKYRVLAKPYSKWRAILAETGQSDTDFLRGLKALHGITIDKRADPMLFVIEDTQQVRMLKEDGVTNPTFCQLLLTSRGFGLTEEEAVANWTAKMKGDE